MQKVKGFFSTLVIVVLILGAITFVVMNYSWVFSKRVTGKILDVQRVTDPGIVLSPRATEAQIHSYSILIQGDDGKLYTASSEDRQWQVAAKGYCVEALLFRYPPWEFKRGNTFFNARLEELKVCPGETLPPPTNSKDTPSLPPPPPETAPPVTSPPGQ